MIAQLLVTEGFTTVEEVAFVPIEDLAGIEGFDEDIAAELQDARARRARPARAASTRSAARARRRATIWPRSTG